MRRGPVLLDARTVAVIGASPDDNKIGGKPIRFLREFGFEGQVFPVNPRYDEIDGRRCYPDLDAIAEPIDVAVIALPYQQALAVVQQCVRKQVRQIVMFSSGYAETGAAGAVRQQELVAALAGGGTRLLGPNTLGVANLATGFIANFGQGFELPRGTLRSGRAGFVSQSGAFGTFIFALSAEQGLGFKVFTVTGNEADITLSEIVEAMLDDADIDLVAGYVEGIRDGRRFLAVAEKARAAGKPLVLIKTGRTPGGSAAAMSHTAAIAGADEVYEAAFRQTGTIRVDDEEAMLDLVAMMRAAKPMAGRRVGVVTMSGGAGVLIADALERSGLELAALHAETEAALAGIVPEFGSTRNPVDLTGQFLTDPGMLEAAMRCLLADDGVDAVVFFLGLGRRYGERIAQTLREIAQAASKPVVVAWIAGPTTVLAELRADGVAVLPSATRAIRALGALARFSEARGRTARSFALPNAGPGERIAAGASGRCSEHRTKTLLRGRGVDGLNEALAANADDAVAHAAAIGYPVALKVCAADLMHKTEAGAVALNLRDEEALREAFERVRSNALAYAPDLAIEGVLVAPMAAEGIDVIVGARRDPVFGPIVMVGSGGIHAEVLRDAAIGVLPLVAGEARQLVEGLRVHPMLAGARGKAPADVDALVGCIEALAGLMIEHPEIDEIEMNPVRVFERGCGAVALDALMVVQPTPESAR